MPSVVDDVRLPTQIEKGAKGGPSFQTTVLPISSGYESRNQDWTYQRHTWDVGYGVQKNSDWVAVLNFFYARRGRARGFRFKDWTDYSATGVQIGVGDGSTLTFQLVKVYPDSVAPYTRKITRPVASTGVVYDNGSPTSFYTIDYTTGTGLVTFSGGHAPAAAHVLTADFQFDVPVRFDVDQLPSQVEWYDAISVPSAPIIELRE